MSETIPAAEPAPAPRRMAASERREQLLDVAAELLTRDGIDALTMELVAEHAGVSKGLGYAYFKNVEDLLTALYDREAGEVYQSVFAAASEQRGFEDKLRAAIHAYFETVTQRGTLFAALRSKLVDRSPSRAARHQYSLRRTLGYEAFYVDLFRDEFGVPARYARAAAGVLLAATDASMRAITAHGLRRREAEEMCIRFALAGLRNTFTDGFPSS